MNFEEVLQYNPYALDKNEKSKLLTGRLKSLTEKHMENCSEYRQILDSMNFDMSRADSYENLPFIPVRLFKELTLKSVPGSEVVKTMTSSGTSGHSTSKIYLDRATSLNQQRAMVKIVSDFTGTSRLPMIIVDCPSVIRNRAMFSARGAGILGFSIFASKKIYALDEDMQLNVEEIKAFLAEHQGKRIFLFGFTFIIWQHFYKELSRLKEEGILFDLSNAVMIHGGGWKKMISEAVSVEEFHDRLKAVCGLDSIHDYYGMVEQTGCIYMQCECGHLHASIFSDVIVRRAKDFSIADMGELGIVQVISTIPESYPGHSLLTEDEGVVLGEDDCPCGRKGKYFKILGRIKNAEIRGCSDTYATNFGRNEKPDCPEEQSSPSDTIADNISYLVGNKDNVIKAVSVSPKGVFDNQVLDFCNALSKELMNNCEARAFPDVVTLGFWLRKSSLNQLQERFADNDSEKIRLGRGVAFHIAPSNVPVNFAYSLFTGLLTGNANIVRVPSKNFPQVQVICNAINKVLENFENLRAYITLIRYERNKNINDYFSRICDIRVIWGGDATINKLRESDLYPRTTEITFADRYSLAVIDANEYLDNDNKERIAQDFYNDTYLSDQNACTSPRVVIWSGNSEKVAQAKELFWSELYKVVQKKYTIQPVQCVDKLSIEYISIIKCVENNLHIVKTLDNLIIRIHAGKLTDDLMNFKGNSGYFYEYDMSDISELKDICNNTHCQTICLLGSKNLLRSMIMEGIKGVDRIVPIGQTMDFDFLWDGYNLMDSFTRIIVMK